MRSSRYWVFQKLLRYWGCSPMTMVMLSTLPADTKASTRSWCRLLCAPSCRICQGGEREGLTGWVLLPPHSVTAPLKYKETSTPSAGPKSAHHMLTLLVLPIRLPARYGHLRPPLPVSPLPAPGDSG